MNRQFVSYPKSGRTWIRYILAQLELDSAIQFHHDSFEFNDGSRPPHDFDLNRRVAIYSHAKVVYLERDPRDVMVSLYYQVTGRFREFFDYRGTISEFIRDQYFGAENLQRFRDMWREITVRHRFLTISYEQCHADMHAVIVAVLSYYELEAGGSEVRGAVANAEFSKMKLLERSGAFPQPWLQPRNDAPKVRAGRIGGFRDVLSREDIAYLDAIFGFVAAGTDDAPAR